ncbi:uncharacterized protein LOC133923201 [Phragmites australis]|uniref:uncharacterized protein LOC133923201 n=1 Tax=Phragmites australis TaxID=29695 RepID=UPI002D76CDD2|nr:uncharacterized protein LOC133923201 [Phragmites australis]
MADSGLPIEQVKEFNDWVLGIGDGTAKVSRQARKFKAVPSTYTIFFTSWTIVEEIPSDHSDNLPLYNFNFVDFEDLDHKQRQGQGLVDVIGQLTVVYPLVHSSRLNGPSIRREVELRDLSDRLLSVTLWGKHAASFEDEFLIETICKDELAVIIFAGLQVKLFLGAPRYRSGSTTKCLQGRGFEVLLLPGDGNATAGGINEENANRKTVSELFTLNPHDNSVFCAPLESFRRTFYLIVISFTFYLALGYTLYMPRKYKRNIQVAVMSEAATMWYAPSTIIYYGSTFH